ncbi:MAG: Ig-like domain-containing protein, partial [Ruminococcus sp.]
LTAELSYGMTYTGNRTFEQCKNLNKLIIPDSITEIGLGCFDYCNNIQTVYYTGDEDKFNSTYLGTLFKNVDVVYNYDLGGSSSSNSSSSNSSSSSSSTTSSSTSYIYIDKTTIILLKGKSTTVKADNTSKKKLKWTTSNSKVATVSQSGKVIAKGKGTATIKATANDGRNKYTLICKVTVKQPVTSVKLNRNSVNLKVKGNAKQKTVTLKAKVYPNNANNKTIKWSTSKSKIATVNSKGKVIAKKRGTCYITATAKDGSKKSAKCKVVVK